MSTAGASGAGAGEAAGGEGSTDRRPPRTPGWFPTPGRASALYLLGLCFLVFGLWIPGLYLSLGTFQLVTEGQAVAGLVALAILVPFAAGAFDLSAGAMVTFSLCIVSTIESHSHLNVIVSCLVALVCCAVAGCLSGIAVVRYNVNSFIATLAMSQILSALALLLSNNQDISGVFGPSFLAFGQGTWLGIPKVLYYVAGVAILLWYLLEWTSVGRQLFATGSNPEAARLAGLPTGKLTVASLATSAVVSGFAGIVFGAQVGSFSNSFGSPLLFPAFAAIFFGATQFKSRPNVWGTVLAVFTLAFGVQGFDLEFPTATFWITTLFDGVALLLAVGVAARAGVVKLPRGKRRDGTRHPALPSNAGPGSPGGPGGPSEIGVGVLTSTQGS